MSLVEAGIKFKNALKQINPQMGLALMEKDDSSINNSVATNQLTHTEANFMATMDISTMPRCQHRH